MGAGSGVREGLWISQWVNALIIKPRNNGLQFLQENRDLEAVGCTSGIEGDRLGGGHIVRLDEEQRQAKGGIYRV